MSEESPSQEVKGAPRRRGRPPKKKLTPEELVLSTEQSSPELAQGYRILQELMKGPHRMFLDPPNNGEKGMSDYHEVIYQPMWLDEMLRKFNSHEYKELSQFAADMRLLLENCYRYFGPNSPRTKRCLKLEQAYQSRVDQLPSELRTQCLLTGTDTQPDDHVIESEGFVSALLAGVSDERSARERDRKSRVAEERRTERQGKDKEILQWEDEVLFPGDTREQMKSMWEIPQIGHFVYLALDALNINEISIFELERVFLMPQASHALAMLMTSLLVSPLVRLKLDNMPPMSYRLWSRKLAYKVANWYKMFHKYDSDPIAAMDKLGIEPDSWKVLGAKNPLEEYQFHELSFHQRVWVVKTLCDHILHNQKCVRDRIGTAEVRDAYKYCLGLDRSGLQYLHFPEFCGDDLRVYRQAAQCTSLAERDLEHRGIISREEAAARRKTKTKKVMEEEEQSSDEEESLDAPDLSSQQRWWKRRGRKPKKRFMWSRYIKDKQLDDQEGEKAPDSQGDPTPDTDDPASPTPAQEVFLGFSDHLGPLTKERDPLYSPHWLSPNPQDFYMVTECMDTLNQLILTMCDDDVELLHRMNRIKSKSSRPTCEVRLAESLQKLANELSPFELQLITSVKKTRMKLHQEWDEFKQRPADYVDPSEAIWLNQPETQDCLAEDKVDVETGELLEDSLVSGEPMSLEETAPTPPADLTEGEVEGSDGVRVSHSRRAKRKRDIARTRVELQDGTEVPEAELSEDLRQELLGSNDDTDGNEEEDDDDPDDVWELPVKKRKVMPAKPRLPLIAGGPKKSRKKKKVPDPPNESDPSATPLKKCRKKKVTAKNAKSGEPGPVVPTKAVLNVDKEGRIVVPMTTTNPALLALQGKTIAEAMREGKVLKNHGSLVLRPAPPPQMEPPEDIRHSDITIKQEPVEVKEEPAPYPPTTIKLERPEDQNNRLAEEIKPSLNAIIKSGVYKHLPSGTNVIFKIFRREDGRIDLVPLNHELVDAGKIQDVPQLSQILTEYQDKVLSQSPDPGNPAPLDSDTFEPSALSDSLPVAPTPVEPQPVPRVKQEMQPIAILRTVKQEVGKMFDFPMEITSCSSTETTQTLTTQFPAQSLKTEAMFAQSQPHAELSHPQVHLQVVNIERLTAQPSRPQSGLFLTDPRQVKVSKQAPPGPTVVYLSDDSSDSVEFVDSTPPPTVKKPPQQPTITPVKQSVLMPSITPVKQSLLMPQVGSPGQQTVLLSSTGKQAMLVSGGKGNLASPNLTPRKIALIQGQNEVTPPRQRIVQASPLSTIQRTPGGTHGMQVAAKHRLNLGTPQKGVPSGQSISPRGAVPGRGGSAQIGVSGRGGSAQMGALGRGGSPQMGTLGRGGSPQIGALGRVGLSQTGSVIRHPAPVAAGAGQYGTGPPYSHSSPGGVMRGTGIKTYSRLPNPQGQPQSPANANMYTRSPASMSASRGPFTQQLMNMQSGYESRMNGIPGQRMPSTRGRKPSLGPVTIINPNQGRGRGSPTTAQTLLSTMLTSSDRGRGVAPSVNHNMLGSAGRGRGANPAPAQQTSAAQVVAHFSDSGLSYLLRLPSGSQIQLTQQQIEELRQKNGGMIPTMI